MVQTVTTPTSTSRVPLQQTENVVVVQRLVKTFRDFWLRARARAVNDVSFEIRRGEIFGLLGPNGSGKSTTIKILLGLLNKTSGAVSVLGKLPSDVTVKERIGYLPEESYLYPFLNARETLEYYAKLFGLSADVRERRIDELLEMVGLTAVQHRAVREYSKGMQRRIGIAQALINDPEFLILDEPTTGLDPLGTRQVKDLIIELGRRGKTILLSSHLLSDVEDCVDRMVILYGGRIQAQGTCNELLESRERTIIETDALDDDTISQIDALIRQRTHGEKSVARVSRPRQRLEELFIDIVERARANNLETAGAQHGGQTASFLKADTETGEELVASLVEAGRNEAQPTPTRQQAAAATAAAANTGADLSVLSDLLAASNASLASQTANPPSGAFPSSPAAVGTKPSAGSKSPTSAADVDFGVIGDLLENPSSGDPKKPGAEPKP